jgi:O-antigen biosynthesis protein
MARLRILAVSPIVPRPDLAAGWRRLFAILELLARSYQVDLFATDQNEDAIEEERYVRDLRSVGVNAISPDALGWLRGAFRRQRYDLGLFEFWHTAADYGALFRKDQPWAKIVVDSVDLHFLREEAAARLDLFDPEAANANRIAELGAYRAADAVIVATDQERQALAEVEGIETICTIPCIVPLRPRPGIERRSELLFVGGFKHAPNADGLLWFVREIWPMVRASVIDAVLTVVGSSAPPEVLALDGREGISICGYVPTTDPYLDRAALSIAPLRYGAGMKGKVTEAMACGLPVVTTTVGAQGFGIVSGEHAIVADEPGAFAAAVIRLLADRTYAERLGQNGRKLVSKQCSPEAVVDRLENLVAQVASATPPTPLSWRVRSACFRLMTLAHRVGRRLFSKSSRSIRSAKTLPAKGTL